jgi:Ni,Fe-hydrogenase I large subunit
MSLPAPATATDVVTALSRSRLGAGLSPEAVARLAAIAEVRTVEADDEVTREDQATHRPEMLIRAYDPSISCATHFLDHRIEPERREEGTG